MIDMSNKNVLEYLNRFMDCHKVTVEEASRIKVVDIICEEYQKQDKESKQCTMTKS